MESSSQTHDLEVGLMYFGHRYLMPHLGRWASPDPLQIPRDLQPGACARHAKIAPVASDLDFFRTYFYGPLPFTN